MLDVGTTNGCWPYLITTHRSICIEFAVVLILITYLIIFCTKYIWMGRFFHVSIHHAATEEGQLQSGWPKIISSNRQSVGPVEAARALLNDEEEQTVICYIEGGCGCHRGPGGKSCLTQFTVTDVIENRLNRLHAGPWEPAEYTHRCWTEWPSASWQQANVQQCFCQVSEGETETVDGIQILRIHCMYGFLFLHSIGWKRLRLLRKQVSVYGIQSVRHGNTGRVLAAKMQTFDDVKNVVKFLQNYAENNALVLPEGAAGHHDCSLQLLPSWETKKVTHVMYVASC